MSDYNKIRKRLKLDRVPHLCSQYYGCKSHQGRGVESLRNSPKITHKKMQTGTQSLNSNQTKKAIQVFCLTIKT